MRDLDPDHPFTQFACELSTMPALIATLLREHPATQGRCPGCRVPPGRPPILSPCGVRSVATLALRIRECPR